MKTISPGKSRTLLVTGLFTIAASQVFIHFVQLPDLARGFSMGIGIGLLLVATVFGNLRPAQ